MMVKFNQHNDVTRPPFRNKLHFGDLIMAEFQVAWWIFALKLPRI